MYPILPAERPAIANVAVTRILAPTKGNSGESLNLKVIVDNQNDAAVDGTLTVTRNGQPVKVENVKLKPGSDTFAFQTTPAEGGLTSYQATFTARDPQRDGYPADNHALAWVSVRGKAKVLVINGQAGAGRYLEEIIKRQGFDVVVRTPDTAPPPAGHKVVIFNNAEREKFSAGYLTAVERHGADGGSFIMLGGDASFAPASYRQFRHFMRCQRMVMSVCAISYMCPMCSAPVTLGGGAIRTYGGLGLLLLATKRPSSTHHWAQRGSN